MFNGSINPFANDEKGQMKVDNLPFYFIGFKSAAPEFTLRRRIWAFLHAQTLYRTVSGMPVNYSKAIKLMYCRNPKVVQLLGGNTDRLECELERMARRKFKLFRCNGIPSSTGKGMRTSNFYCVLILIFKLHTLKRSWPGRKVETRRSSPLSLMATASLIRTSSTRTQVPY